MNARAARLDSLDDHRGGQRQGKAKFPDDRVSGPGQPTIIFMTVYGSFWYSLNIDFAVVQDVIEAIGNDQESQGCCPVTGTRLPGEAESAGVADRMRIPCVAEGVVL